MDVAKFQTCLEQLCQTAKESGDQLTQEQLRKAFDGFSLERDQLLKILKYLKMQGIEIEGANGPGKTRTAENAATQNVEDFSAGYGSPSSAEQNADISLTGGTKVPLTPEEKDYLREYLADISGQKRESAEYMQAAESPDSAGAADAAVGDGLPALFKRLSWGDDLAMAQLTQRYLPVAAEMAAEMNCAEIALPDLIQEANVGLLTALSEPEPSLKNDLWLRTKIRRSIAEAIEEQSQQKFRDDCLVARVEKLESAVRDLTDEDGENRFSIDELAVILDMTADEIRDILKLTGDDK